MSVWPALPIGWAGEYMVGEFGEARCLKAPRLCCV